MQEGRVFGFKDRLNRMFLDIYKKVHRMDGNVHDSILQRMVPKQVIQITDEHLMTQTKFNLYSEIFIIASDMSFYNVETGLIDDVEIIEADNNNNELPIAVFEGSDVEEQIEVDQGKKYI